MAQDRSALNKAAGELRNKYGFTGDCPAVFAANIQRVFGIFHAYVEEGHTDEEISIAVKPVNDAIALFNDEARRERLEQLESMPQADAVKDFMCTQCVKGFTVGKDKENGWQVSEDDSVAVSAFDMVKSLFPVEKAGIIDACCIIADNIVKWHFKNDEKSAVNRKGLSEHYISLRKRRGWEINVTKCSKSALAKQLTEIVGMVCPGLEINMINADVTFLETSIIQGKSVADKAGSYTLRNEETIVNFLYRAAFTRYNKLPYDFQNGTRADKTPASEGANKDMAEVEPKTPKADKVTAEKVEIPAAEEKKPAKKTTRKSTAKKAEEAAA